MDVPNVSVTRLVLALIGLVALALAALGCPPDDHGHDHHDDSHDHGHEGDHKHDGGDHGH